MVALGQHLEGGESVGVQGLPWSDGFLNKGIGGVLVYPANRFHGDKTRFPVIVLAGHQYSCLVLGSTPQLARPIAALKVICFKLIFRFF